MDIIISSNHHHHQHGKQIVNFFSDLIYIPVWEYEYHICPFLYTAHWQNSIENWANNCFYSFYLLSICWQIETADIKQLFWGRKSSSWEWKRIGVIYPQKVVEVLEMQSWMWFVFCFFLFKMCLLSENSKSSKENFRVNISKGWIGTKISSFEVAFLSEEELLL